MSDTGYLFLGVLLGAVATFVTLYIIALQKRATLTSQIDKLQAAQPDNAAIPMLRQLVTSSPTCACGGTIQP